MRLARKKLSKEAAQGKPTATKVKASKGTFIRGENFLRQFFEFCKAKTSQAFLSFEEDTNIVRITNFEKFVNAYVHTFDVGTSAATVDMELQEVLDSLWANFRKRLHGGFGFEFTCDSTGNKNAKKRVSAFYHAYFTYDGITGAPDFDRKTWRNRMRKATPASEDGSDSAVNALVHASNRARRACKKVSVVSAEHDEIVQNEDSQMYGYEDDELSDVESDSHVIKQLKGVNEGNSMNMNGMNMNIVVKEEPRQAGSSTEILAEAGKLIETGVGCIGSFRPRAQITPPERKNFKTPAYLPRFDTHGLAMLSDIVNGL